MKPAHLNSIIKHDKGNVMVWGCISAGGVGQLDFIGKTVDNNIYLNILR